MNDLKIFENAEFGKIRVQVVNDEPMFCLSDVCKVLEIGNPSQAKTRLKKDGVITNEVSTPIVSQGIDTGKTKTTSMTFINEPNLYKLIFQSRKESAERFTDWVTSEVLPSIRKHGAYMTEQTIEKALTDPDFLIKLATNLKEEQKKRVEARETYIQDKLGCKFIRLDYRDEDIVNVMKVIKQII